MNDVGEINLLVSNMRHKTVLTVYDQTGYVTLPPKKSKLVAINFMTLCFYFYKGMIPSLCIDGCTQSYAIDYSTIRKVRH
jgi:hypothetical protein